LEKIILHLAGFFDGCFLYKLYPISCQSLLSESLNRVLKNKNQVVRRGALQCDKRGIFKHM